MLHSKLIGLMVTLLTTSAIASPLAFVSGPVTYSGSGCPKNSTSITISPNSTTVSALFGPSYSSNFSANTYKVVLKNCTVRVPIEVSAGYRLTVTGAEYRGAATLARRSFGYFRAYNAIKDRFGSRYSGNLLRYLSGGMDETFDYSVDRNVRSIACGGKMELRFYSEYYLLHYSKTESSDLSIDSLDFSLLYPGAQIKLEACR